MTVVIVQNKNIPREPSKKTVKRKTGEDRHAEFSSKNHHMTITKAKEMGYARDVTIPSGEFVLVGDTTGEGNLKSKIFGDNHSIKDGFVYTEKDKHLLDLPKTVSNVGQFTGEVRMYSKDGVQSVVEGETITIFKTKDRLYFRVGKTHKQSEAEARLAKIGVYRQ